LTSQSVKLYLITFLFIKKVFFNIYKIYIAGNKFTINALNLGLSIKILCMCRSFQTSLREISQFEGKTNKCILTNFIISANEILMSKTTNLQIASEEVENFASMQERRKQQASLSPLPNHRQAWLDWRYCGGSK
jgi:hypothetical protein